jgi:thiol-disulfide isomerase/thioredoxin
LKRLSLRSLILLFLCLSLTLLFPGCAQKEKETSFAPDFNLKTLSGKEITLSGLKGRVVLLDFWATWCGPCKDSIPHLLKLYKTNEAKGFEIVGISLDKKDPEAVRRFVKSMGIPYPVLIAPEGFERNYGVSALPTCLLIDKEGRTRERFIGFNSVIAKQMAAKISDLAAEK